MKNKTTAGVLALFFGGIGIHKFYLGKSGWMYLLFFWTFIPVFIALFDAIKLFQMSQESFDLAYNSSGIKFNLEDIAKNKAKLVADLSTGKISQAAFDIEYKLWAEREIKNI